MFDCGPRAYEFVREARSLHIFRPRRLQNYLARLQCPGTRLKVIVPIRARAVRMHAFSLGKMRLSARAVKN